MLLWHHSYKYLIISSSESNERGKLIIMKFSELLGWIIGAVDLVFMVYAIFDFVPFILMVGISVAYIVIMIFKNSSRARENSTYLK